MTTQSPAPPQNIYRNLAVLIFAQGWLGAQMPMIFTLAALAGQSLAPNICWATLPITLTVAGSMLSATPLSAIMQRHGRAAGFALGALGGAAGAALGAYGLYVQSFALFCAGAALTGIYMSSQGFYRFAAADAAPETLRPKAISWVMGAGLFSALFGPQLVRLTTDAWVVPFLGTYATIIVLNLVGLLAFGFLKIPLPAKGETGAPTGRNRHELLQDPVIVVSIICATVTFALMNLVMTSSPLAVVGCGFATADAANVVSAHVLAMYVPSFFTGHIIARFGAPKVISLGLMILLAAGLTALTGVELTHFYAVLILLGIGWNFGFIGATTLLTSRQSMAERGRLQGLNDVIVFGGVTLASLASGGLMNCSGGSAVAGWQMVNLAMLPFLVLAGGALIWLHLRPIDER